MTKPLTNVSFATSGRIKVGDELKDIVQNGVMAMDSRDPSKSQRFMVTAIHPNGTIDLKPVY